MKNVWFDWGVGAAAAVLIGAGLAYVGVNTRAVEADTIDDNCPEPARAGRLFHERQRSQIASSSEMKRVSVLRNETLSSVLDRIGAPREEANSAVFAASQLLDLRSMRPGDDVTAWLETGDDGAVRLTGISLRPEADTQVLVSLGADGTWTPHELKAKLSPGINYVSADVDQSIYQTALGLGAGDQQVVDFADIFGYDIDFQREVHPGDHFGMLYETFEDERGAAGENRQRADGGDGRRGADQDVLPLHAERRWRGRLFRRDRTEREEVPDEDADQRRASFLRLRQPQASDPRLHQAAQGHGLRRADRHADLCGGQWHASRAMARTARSATTPRSSTPTATPPPTRT